MLTFLRKIFWQPPEMDEKVVDAVVELKKRSEQLRDIRLALKDIKATSERKVEVLQKVASVHPISITPSTNEVFTDEKREEDKERRQSVG